MDLKFLLPFEGDTWIQLLLFWCLFWPFMATDLSFLLPAHRIPIWMFNYKSAQVFSGYQPLNASSTFSRSDLIKGHGKLDSCDSWNTIPRPYSVRGSGNVRGKFTTRLQRSSSQCFKWRFSYESHIPDSKDLATMPQSGDLVAVQSMSWGRGWSPGNCNSSDR